MSEEAPRGEREEAAAARGGEAEGAGPPRTPFDSPYFLPVLLWGFTLYFGYDAWISNHEWQKFNRFGFLLGIAMSVYYTATSFRPLPFALAGTWAALALVFGAMAFLADGWWNQGEEAASGHLFTRGFFGLSVLMTLATGLRARLRLRRAAAGASPR